MRKIYLLLISVIMAVMANAQVTVTVDVPTNTTPNLAASYASLAAAVTAVNGITAMSGPVILTSAAGSETAPAGGYAITNPLGTTSTNTITFNTSGAVTLTASGALTAGNLNDAIFKLIGADWITINGFTMLENPANLTTAAASNNMTEWGVALLYVTTTNGSQNCTIQNNTITLNRVYQNTFGIYSNSTHTNAAVTTSATATTTAGGNSGLKIYGNTISNVNQGIVIVGPTAAADANTGIDVGGTGGAQANSITNYGTTATFSGYANVSGTVNGILVRNSNGFNVSYNTVTSSVGGTTVGTLNGIQIPAASATPTTTFTNTINNNNISLQSAVAAGAMNGITYPSGSASTTSTVNINSNNFNTFGHTVVASGTITFITISSTNQFTTINSNTFTNITVNTTGSVTFISHSFSMAASGTTNVNSNSIVTAFNKTGAGGTVTCTTTGASSPNGTAGIYTGNNFSNITVTGATGITGINNTDGFGTSPSKTATGNTFNSWTGGTSAILAINFGYIGATTSSISTNTVTNLTCQSTITGIAIGSSFSGATTLNVSSNTITGLSSTGTGASVSGITCSNTSTTININANTINTLSSTGASSTVLGISVTGATTTNVFQNTINTLSGSGATSPVCNGISVSAGTTVNVYKNKIYDLLESGAISTTSPAINGIVLSSGTTVTAYNNLVGDLRAPAASLTDAIRGISVTSATALSTYNVYYNTVYLNASSTGVNFGTSGIFHTTSATATTAALNLRNNIIHNTSTAAGTGFTVAYRRSSTTLTNFVSTSNNNDFYASATVVSPYFIFHDGTTGYQIAGYKTLVSPRDASSFSEDPEFQSVVGSNANFLKYKVSSPKQVENGGVNIATYTDDYIGTIRAGNGGYAGTGTAPDIGAWELEGIPADLTAPTISYTALSNSCTGGPKTLTATITDASGVPTSGVGLPVAYFKINAGAYTPATGTFVSGSTYTFSIGAGSVTGDIVSYYVVAQDNAGTPNVGAFPSAGASGFTPNPPAAAIPPTTPSSYSVLATLAAGTYGVGSTAGPGGEIAHYATLTAAVADYNSKCLGGNIIFVLTDAAYAGSETFPITINANPAADATHTLTIQPNTAVASTITSATGTAAVIKMLNAKYVTVDGLNTGGSSLTLTNANTTTASAGVWLASTVTTGPGNSNIAIKNCTINGGSNTVTTEFGIVAGVDGASPSTTGGLDNDNVTIQGNTILKCYYGIYANGTSATSSGGDDNLTISNNTIGPSASGASNIGFDGMSIANALTVNITGNTVQNLVASATNAGAIRLESNVNGFTISGNSIHDISSSTSSSGTSSICAIYMGSAVINSPTSVKNNIIKTIVNTNTGGYGSRAIIVNTGNAASSISIYNNSISDIYCYQDALNSYWPIGIDIDGSSGGINVYYNSVNLFGSHTGFTSTTGAAAALFINTSGTSLDIRDNILSNSYDNTTSTGDKSYAIYTTATTAAQFSTINYNDYYASGATGVLGSLNAVDRTTLAAWQTATGQDANSISADPLFSSPTVLQPSPGSPLVAAGTPITGITTDILSVVRNVTTPTIGAYETAIDVVGPTITYTALSNTCATSARTLTASISDASGVPTSGIGLPVLYWRINANPWNTATGTFTGGSNYDFTFGSGVVATNVVQYYIVAQDGAGTPNVSAFPSAGAGGFTINPPAASTPPTTPSSYTIQNTLAAGTYLVGTGQVSPNYATLTAAVAAYNTSCLTGPVIFELQDAGYTTAPTGTGEVFPITINANADASATNTLTIKPKSGVTASITGSVGTGAIIKLNGADYVTIDGSNNGTSSKNLTITNTNTATSGNAVIWLASASASDGATNNTIKNCIITGNASTTTQMGIFSGGTASISTSGNALASNNTNTYQNNTLSKSQYGIFVIDVSTGTLGSGLTISGNTLGSSTAGDGFNFEGIDVRLQNGATISNNDVQNIVTSGSTNLQGINIQDSKSSTISANKVHFMSYTGASTIKLYGITTSTSTFNVVGNQSVNTYANNIVYDLASTATSASWNTSGINNNGGYNDKYYFNSVYLTGQMSNGTAGSAAFSNGNGISSTNCPVIDIRNNIFYMKGSSTVAATLYSHYTTLATYSGSTLNYNDLLSTASGSATAQLGFFNSANRLDLAAWQAATTLEANSISSDPLFNSNTNLQPQTGSPVVGAGTPVSVTTDITGFVRSATTPTIGAYENAGDFVGPVISYTALGNTCATSSRTLTASISDASGVPTSGAGLPVLYWRINANPWSAAAGTFVSGNNYDFTFGSGVVATNVVQYYIVAQDGAGTPNVSAFPSAGAGGFTINPPAASTPPTTPSSYTIQTTLAAGTYTVGTAGAYTTLTAAVAAYNTSCLAGAIIFELLDASYTTGPTGPGETFPITINANADASATNKLTIRPASGVTASISGTSASCMFILNGADYVTIDGSNNGTSSRDLTITNTNAGTSSAVICIESLGAGLGATNNVVKNTNMVGTTLTAANGTLFGVFAGSTTISNSSNGADNDNNTIQNNNITKTQYGIYSGGESAVNKNTGTVISQNVMNAASPNNLNLGGIYVRFDNGTQISQNDISVIRHDGTIGQTGTAFGIALGLIPSGTVTTFTGSDVTGASVTRNKINGVTQLQSTGWSCFGIVANSVTSGTTLVANNMISAVNAASTPTDFSAGIVAGGGTGSTTNVYYNSVAMTGSRGAATMPSYGLAIGGSDPIVDVRDNIFQNTQTSSSTGKMYAIGTGSTTFANMSSNYNDFNVSGASAFVGQTGGLGTAGTDRLALSDWQTATTKDANSKTVTPVFISSSDLHLSNAAGVNCQLDGTATPVSVTVDFDNATRDAAAPDMGADEFTSVPSSTLAAVPAGAQVCSNVVVSGSGTIYKDASCNAIAKVLPNGGSPVSGMVNSCVKIEFPVPTYGGQAYVQRHFDITPAVNQSTATARITLYVLQIEFTDYNNNNGTEPDLPSGPADAVGIANLRITKYSGNGTLPGTYSPGVATLINPVDADIVWDAVNSWWAISFDVTGFSGFFIHTGFGPLPVTILNFSGYKDGSRNQLRWTTTSESNNRGFEVQRSTDGVNYSALGFVNSQALGGNSTRELNYSYTDNNVTGSKQYYRLRQVDFDNHSKLSNIVLIKGDKPVTLMIDGLFPNPASTLVNVLIAAPNKDKVTLVVTDIAGRTVAQQVVSVETGSNTIPVDISRLSNGTYMVKLVCESNCEGVVGKFVKQ